MIHLPNWRSVLFWRAPAKNFNLIDFGPPPRVKRRTAYWMSMSFSILAHGAFLAYVLGFGRVPDRAEATEGMTFIGTAEREALPRTDRESRHAEAAPGEGLDAPFPSAAEHRPIADLPGEPPPFRPSGPPSLAVLNRPGDAPQLPPAQIEARLDDARAVEAAPHETRLSFHGGGKDVLLQDSRGEKADLAEPPMPTAAHAVPPPERAGAVWLAPTLPEDGGAARAVLPGQPAPAGSATPPRLALMLTPPARETIAPPLSVPLPVRRTALSSVASLGPQAEIKADPIDSYRANVRAHLAEHRPNGGPGSGNVVVGFTLSRTGKLVSARILESSGRTQLDESVLDAVRRSAPFPKAPEAAKTAHLQFAIPFRFR
ncbi:MULTISPECIES: energy transducer TonB [Rhodomicrobium]|uniref:energy transducer TonB family protein n=1 Tax=Rhodomicrobium TaxID=1068 RepID=UPI0014822390|nr:MULTISPECIES: energy transducer TonB [Rhodomicrobium]